MAKKTGPCSNGIGNPAGSESSEQAALMEIFHLAGGKFPAFDEERVDGDE